MTQCRQVQKPPGSVLRSVRQKMDSEEAQNEREKEQRGLGTYLFPPKNSGCSLKQVLI